MGIVVWWEADAATNNSESFARGAKKAALRTPVTKESSCLHFWLKVPFVYMPYRRRCENADIKTTLYAGRPIACGRDEAPYYNNSNRNNSNISVPCGKKRVQLLTLLHGMDHTQLLL